MVSELMVFIQDSSALDEKRCRVDGVRQRHQDEKDNKKVQIYSKIKNDDF